MKIKLPNLKGKEKYINDKQSIVLIGANGSGKTRMSIWIEENNKDVEVHRISAQKSLNMPAIVNTSELKKAEDELFYGYSYGSNTDSSQYKRSNRWNDMPETHLLNDFEALMRYLFTEDYEKSIEFREKRKQGDTSFENTTILEKIKKIWENVITHRKIKIKAGKIEVFDRDIDEEEYKGYNGSEMSDGERAIFYFIGEVLSVPRNSLIIIDEPENHLHKSILVRLWDTLETERKDCIFLYITHSFEFSVSRINSQIFWIKKINGVQNWDYEEIDCTNSDKLLLEILGNRQKVLLVEGKDTSIDIKLYSKLYPEFNIIPVESCNAVIQGVKSYNKLNEFHYIELKGIIDRDRRNEKQISEYKKENIFVPEVAEIENLFLLPEVIKIVCYKQSKQNDCIEINKKVESKVFEFLNTEKNNQALLFTKQECENTIIETINVKSSTIDEYKNIICKVKDIKVENIFNRYCDNINKILKEKDLIKALKIINNKGLLSYTKLSNCFGWKANYYVDYVIRLLNENVELKEILKKYIQLNKID